MPASASAAATRARRLRWACALPLTAPRRPPPRLALQAGECQSRAPRRRAGLAGARARRSPPPACREECIMAVFSTSPFETLLGLQQALDAFRTSGWLDAGPSGGGAYPPINVFRK